MLSQYHAAIKKF